ncbi:MAG: 23S rRNA (adenine(2030)-N(6))-methyltransferase RlmJ [Micavibrio sp.]|nr:23S rRNA (adenine(2030)-N(6))-methyltransferase RlmJ [Micavibrio sp.]
MPRNTRIYIDTHAGRGAYDLSAPEAIKIAEFETGMTRLDPARLPKPFAPFVKALEKNAPLYPGSAACIAALKTKGEAMHLFELHPQELKHLQRALGKQPKVKIHQKDGHAGAINLTSNNAFIAIDPSYEIKSEYAQAAQTINTLYNKSPKAVQLIWYPVLAARANRHEELLSAISAPHVNITMKAPFKAPPEKGMLETGLVIVNAPEYFDRIAQNITDILSRILLRT